MEDELVEAIVVAVITAVRKDLIKMLMDTECCKWSKRRVKKLLSKIRTHEANTDAVDHAMEMIRKQMSPLPSMLRITTI